MKRVGRYDFVHENKKYHVEGNGILFASAPVDVLVEDLSNGNVIAKYQLEAYSEMAVGEMCKAASYVVDRDDAPKYRSWYITQEKTDMFKLKHDAMVAAQMYEHNKRVVDTGTRLIDFIVHTFVLRPGADIPEGLYEVLFVLNQMRSEGLSNERCSI